MSAKARLAMEESGFEVLGVGGGVAANAALRDALEQLAAELECELHIPPLSLCTDNAAMGAIAVEKYLAEEFSALDLDISAGLRRG